MLGLPEVRRRALTAQERLLVGPASAADAIELHATWPDDVTPEAFARAMLDGRPEVERLGEALAQRVVLRVRLSPRDPACVQGWRVVTSTPELVVLRADGPLLSATMVTRKVDAHTAAVVTATQHHRPDGRLVWLAVAPLHRAWTRVLLLRVSRALT